MSLHSNVKFTGLAKVIKAFKRIPGRWPKAANKLTKTAGNAIYRRYHKNLSGSKPSTASSPLPVGVITGTLKAGAYKKQINQYRVDIGNDVLYSGFIEFGTSKMAPRRPLTEAVEWYSDGELPNDAHQVVVDIWRE